MEFITRICDNDKQCSAATVTSFRQVTIFGINYTKIVYMHSEDDFTIEKVDPAHYMTIEEMTQVVSGPRASEIIQKMLEDEKKRGSTFVWNGVHFKNNHLKNNPDEFYTEDGKPRDPLAIDPIQPEVERRKHRRRKEDREYDGDERRTGTDRRKTNGGNENE
jgi:hypothetical protein